MGSITDKAFDKVKEKQETERRKMVMRNIQERLAEMSEDDLVYTRQMIANLKNVKSFFTTMHHLSRNLG